jgi:chromosome segregation ATPase
MKSNAVAIILVLACLGLGAVLLVDNKKHAEEKQKQDNTIQELTNTVSTLDGKLSELRVVNSTLETNLALTKLEDSNALAAARAELASTAASLEKSQADAKAAQAAADAVKAGQDKKISDLEAQNLELDKQSNDLRGSITNLETQILATQKKLAASEGDRELLLKELKTLQAQKEELEKKFNDLAVLRDQVRKLKDELSIARRLDWIRRGIYDSITEKGGERLIHPAQAAPPATSGALNVELRQSGGVKVTPPASTNAAPAK